MCRFVFEERISKWRVWSEREESGGVGDNGKDRSTLSNIERVTKCGARARTSCNVVERMPVSVRLRLARVSRVSGRER